MDIDIKVTGVGEFRSFADGEHAGFLRMKTPHRTFDLPLTEEQLSAFLAAVFIDERPLTAEEKEHAETLVPPEQEGHTPVPSSTSTVDPYVAPAFGDEDGFDLEEAGEEQPLRLTHSITEPTPRLDESSL